MFKVYLKTGPGSHVTLCVCLLKENMQSDSVMSHEWVIIVQPITYFIITGKYHCNIDMLFIKIQDSDTNRDHNDVEMYTVNGFDTQYTPSGLFHAGSPAEACL